MSAPNTNVEKQEENHKGPLVGMRMVLVYAAILLAAFLAWTAYNGDGAEVEGEAGVSANVEQIDS